VNAAVAQIDRGFDGELLSASENVIGFPREMQRVVLSEPTQRWTPSVVAQIEGHLRLPVGWDGHHAPQLKLETVIYAIRVLSAICKPNTPAPSVVPTTSGGLQFEWHLPALDLEIAIRAPAKVDVYARDDGGEVERELSVDFRPLIPWIDRLS
jgi:hypothetical protein